MSNSLIEIGGSEEEFAKERKCDTGKSVLLFGADWHEACPTLKMVLNALAAQMSGISFFNVDADVHTMVCEQYKVTMVPTVILLLGGDAIYERLEGDVLSDPSHVTLAVQRLKQATATTAATAFLSSADNASTEEDNSSQDPKRALNERLEKLIRGDTVMLFMKGNPSKPRCGFSRQAIELLNENEVTFGSFDILSDEDVRQGLKEFSDWPTYPQIYVRGELMGGLDIMKETAAEGSLKEEWDIADTSSSSATDNQEGNDERLRKLINRSDIMLFMKGLPSGPKCGFSRQIVDILDETGVPYDAFDILSDEDIRQGLKVYSDWPTYPQLYVKGELMGGLDIVLELKESNELKEMLNP